MSPRRLLLAALTVLALIGAGVALASTTLADPRPAIDGVRLGMTADEVRARVDERGDGTWSASSSSGDWVLEHTAGEEHARFELHDGQLMAIRLESSARADLLGPALEVTDSTVLRREVEGGQIAVTLLSRSCPTHRAEAEALVRSAGPSDR